ncbi:GDP-mannose 4,6-dehydratase [bacterium]|nr:GDP-mannose 4,6-dehydratase [bacterium]
MKDKHVLVTGGAGFVGSHLVRRLLKDNRSVICVDNFNDFYNPLVKENNVKPFLSHKDFKLYRVDIRDFDSLKEIFSSNKISRVVHLAARAGVRPSLENPLLYEDVNLRGTMHLLELSKNVENFIFASSSSVYGNNKKTPFSERDNVDEAISPYAATKKAGEVMCHVYHHLYNIPISCLRFFTVYGPSGRPDMAPYKFTKLIDEGKEVQRFGNGHSKRDYTYVDDIVDGVISTLDRQFKYEIFNLGNSHPIKLNYFIGLIEKELGKKAKIVELPSQPGDVNITYADIGKSKKMLNFQPKVSIENGIAKLVKWYKSSK